MILNLIFSLFLTSGSAHAGGVDVGNGGDTVICRASPADNDLYGYYFLDYIMTLGNSTEIAPPLNTIAASKRITQLLVEKYPALADSWKTFLSYTSNLGDWTQDRIWLLAPHGLVDINDQSVLRRLPPNCIDTVGHYLQTVVRVRQDKIIRYEYDGQAVQELSKRPLQYSYLLVHEWLWDLTSDVQSIRWANNFLHSEEADRLSAADFKTSLEHIGIYPILKVK